MDLKTSPVAKSRELGAAKIMLPARSVPLAICEPEDACNLRRLQDLEGQNGQPRFFTLPWNAQTKQVFDIYIYMLCIWMLLRAKFHKHETQQLAAPAGVLWLSPAWSQWFCRISRGSSLVAVHVPPPVLCNAQWADLRCRQLTFPKKNTNNIYV